jgi:hypothetical protein
MIDFTSPGYKNTCFALISIDGCPKSGVSCSVIDKAACCHTDIEIVAIQSVQINMKRICSGLVGDNYD